jgi:hypothetical protein
MQIGGPAAASMKTYLDYQLTKAPEERRRANQADVDTFLKGDQQFETARHNAAMDGKPPQGSWVDSGQVTKDGLKVFLNTSTKEMQDANGRPLGQYTGAPAGTNPNAPPDNGLRPTPKAMPEHVQTSVNAAAQTVDQVRDLRSRFTDDMTGARAFIAGNEEAPMGKVKGAPEADRITAEWWGNARSVIGDLRKQLSGQSLTASEKNYFDSTSVGPSSSPKSVREYLDRLEKTLTVGAARTQALAEPGSKFDGRRGVVLDPNGQPVPGTESPFAARASAAPQRDNSIRANVTRGVGPKVGDVEDGYRYKGGPKGLQSSWEKL